MKRVIFLLVIMVWAFPIYAQEQVWHPEIKPEYLTVQLDSADTDTIYVLFWPTRESQRYAVSETAPTSSAAQAQLLEWTATGDFYIHMITDTLTRDASDSLSSRIKPLIYDKTKAVFKIVEKDSSFLNWSTPGTYAQSTVSYLDWTHGKCYGVQLSNELWSTAGFALIIKHTSAGGDAAGCAAKLYFGFWQVH